MPTVRRHVTREYGGKTGNQQICPGEDACEDFESAAGASRADKEQNACLQCPMFPTKINTEFEKEERYLDALLSRALFFRRYRNSGESLDIIKERSRHTVFECLLMLDELFERKEKDLRLETNFYLESLLKRF